MGGRTPTGIRLAFAVSSVIAAVAAGWFGIAKWRGAGLTDRSADGSTDPTDEGAVDVRGGGADAGPESSVTDD